MTDIKRTPIVAHILTGLVTLGLGASSAFKLSGAQAIVENFEKLHLTPFRVPIGVIELVSVALFAIPKRLRSVPCS
jgi:hypothetical protein